MRCVFLGFLAVGGFLMADPASAQTTTQYPFCIQGVDRLERLFVQQFPGTPSHGIRHGGRMPI